MVGPSGKIIAADLQQGMLDLVRKKIKGTNIESRIELHKCEEDRIGITEKVDLVLAFIMIHEVRNKEKLFCEIKSILKPHGRFYIIELKMHPPRKDFEETVRIAREIGFGEIERPKFLLSRAILLEK